MTAPQFLSYSRTRYNEDGDSAQYSLRVKLPVGWTLSDLRDWARESFNTQCHHQYDCCGHWYRWMRTYDAKRVRSRTYYVTVHWNQNI